MWKADYHIHSISPDAGVPMESMCLAAVERGLEEIAFTDHYEFYAHGIHREYFDRAYLERYFRELRKVKQEFAGRLRIRCGVEMGQLHLDRKEAFQIIRSYPFDFIIGSLHKIENVDLGAADFTGRTVPALAESYYRHLLLLSEEGEFDCLGHLDLFKRYARRNGFPDYEEVYMPLIEEVLKNIIARGKGIEINTSGVRQGNTGCMPELSVLKLYRRLGGRILTIGSDAHRPEDVGADLDTALRLAVEAGFEELASYSRRCVKFQKIQEENK